MLGKAPWDQRPRPHRRAQLADAVISGPPTEAQFCRLLPNKLKSLEQTIARGKLQRKKLEIQKKAYSKMYVDRKRKRKQKKEARGK